MKKFMLSALAAMVILSCFSFKQLYDLRNNTAEVEQMQGCYIFTDSKPVKEYDFLGTENATWGGDSQYEGVRDKLIRKAKKSFPSADGLIFHFKSGGTDHVDVVKFK